METKKSKIAQIEFKRSFKGDYGLTYVYQVVMEDGAYGELNCKTENKYKVGDELNYNLTNRTYNGQTIWTIKVVNENKGFKSEDPQRQASIIRQSTMQMTIDLVCAGKVALNEFEKWQKYFETYAKNLK